jgi:hypothetical protein
MTTRTKHSIPWYLWPVVALWQLVATIIELVGRFVAILLGFVLFVVGAVVSLTIVGAIVGIPLMLFGGMLVLRGMF